MSVLTVHRETRSKAAAMRLTPSGIRLVIDKVAEGLTPEPEYAPDDLPAGTPSYHLVTLSRIEEAGGEAYEEFNLVVAACLFAAAAQERDKRSNQQPTNGRSFATLISDGERFEKDSSQPGLCQCSDISEQESLQRLCNYWHARALGERPSFAT